MMDFSIKITPNAARNAVLGWKNEVLRISLMAPALDGKANKALLLFLSELVGCKRSEVEIVRGMRVRTKIIRFFAGDLRPLLQGKQEKLL